MNFTKAVMIILQRTKNIRSIQSGRNRASNSVMVLSMTHTRDDEEACFGRTVWYHHDEGPLTTLIIPWLQYALGKHTHQGSICDYFFSIHYANSSSTPSPFHRTLPYHATTITITTTTKQVVHRLPTTTINTQLQTTIQ